MYLTTSFLTENMTHVRHFVVKGSSGINPYYTVLV